MTLKISRITNPIGFYVLNSFYDSSCDASQIDRHEKQWCHFLNKIFIVLEHLIWSTVKL